MVVSIRSDCCIALRMIALQAWYASEQELWEIEIGFWQNEKIEKQEAEILRLRAENRLLETVILDMAGELGVKPDNEEIIVAIDRLRAENEKLRAALAEIGYDFSTNRDEAAIVARKVLR